MRGFGLYRFGLYRLRHHDPFGNHSGGRLYLRLRQGGGDFRHFKLGGGHKHGRLGGQQRLAVVLAVRPGLSRERLDELTARVGRTLAASQAVADHVDSLELQVVPA